VIYTVTCIKYEPHRSRCWGYFVDVRDAERAVLSNATDMFELGWYDHAVIEKVPEGICRYCEAVSWYFADYSARDADDVGPTVTKIERPEWAAQTCNWGMS
jgi:hypothetical protein